MLIKNIILAIVLFTISTLSNADPTSCDRIESVKDDFTDEVSVRTPMLTPASIIKIKPKGKNPHYYLSLSTTGSTVVVDGNGAFILFSDGKKWSKSVKIDVDASRDGFVYDAFIPLTNSDLKLFGSKKISKFKLYIFEHSMSESEASMFMQDVLCIVKS